MHPGRELTASIHFQGDLNLPQTEGGEGAAGSAVRPAPAHRAEDGDQERGGGQGRRGRSRGTRKVRTA